jgi:hypothetical protein
MNAPVRRSPVSLLEVVVAVVILGLTAAIAIPRLTRAALPPTDLALRAQLRVLRLAIERYRQDHDAYPAQRGDGNHAAGTVAAFVSQLTHFSDAAGIVSQRRDGRFRFGPYLREGIPPCAVVAHDKRAHVHVLGGPNRAPRTGEGEAGWVYHLETGDIAPCSDGRDAQGLRYGSY